MGGTGDLSDVELRRLTQQVIAPGASEPFGVYVFRAGDDGALLGRHVERAVFLESFGNSPDLLSKEYEPYEPASVFICVVDQMRRLPAGVMRVLLPSNAGFKSFNDLESVWGERIDAMTARTGIQIDPRNTWDIATLAVAEEYRGKATMGLVSMGLYQALTMSALSCGVGWFVAILDMPVFRMIRWKLHMIFAGYKGVTAMPYLGSAASIPAWCDVVEAEKRLASTDPDLYSILAKGIGLEAALRPLDMSTAQGLVA
jgi:hypothetical protein